jgi:VCBS repeat-containing protein
LDDTDDVTETLQSLAIVTANASGNWSATLPAPLEGGQGLRTMSTVPDAFTITGLDADTTSRLSVLYGGVHQVFLPIVVRSR